MISTLPFANLLPESDDPAKAALRENILRVLNSKGEILPSANSPRGMLWRLVNSPKSTIEDCAEVVKLDSTLSTRIFRIAQSASFGLNVANISDALHALGLKFIREQLFNSCVFRQFSEWVLPPEWDLFWVRNIFVARLCERIAGVYVRTNGSEYLAGLIHDMGWLFLAAYAPAEYAKLSTCGKPMNAAEREIFSFGHAEISAAIAVRSNLPSQAGLAILDHHGHEVSGIDVFPGKSPHFLSVVLRLADGIADCCQMDMFGPCQQKLEELVLTPEFCWLNHFSVMPDLWDLAEEEVTKAKEIYQVYFTNN